MTEVLVLPNVTYSRNLAADSFVCDLRSILPRLAKLLPEHRFTLLLPEEEPSLAGENVSQVEWREPSYPNTMRAHFDAKRFLEIVDYRKRSWDVVWSHLPEHTLAAKNVLYNATDERPVFVGYSHWVELPELHTMAANMFGAWVSGVREMAYCGVTTRAMKALILRRAAAEFGDPLARALDRIVFPQYLGVEPAPEVPLEAVVPGLMVWNHRPHTYTGFPSVLRSLDALWERRKDFAVVVSLADGEVAGKPYAAISGLPAAGAPGYRAAYFALLSRAQIGLPRLVSHWTWPVAVADGMAAGMPYVVPRDFYEGEVFPADYPWFYSGSGSEGGVELTDALDRALDDRAGRSVAVAISRSGALATSWDVRIEKFVGMFAWAHARLPRIGERSKKYTDVRRIADGGATKAELKKAMGWGVGIPWTPYRTRLLDEGVPATASAYGVSG